MSAGIPSLRGHEARKMSVGRNQLKGGKGADAIEWENLSAGEISIKMKNPQTGNPYKKIAEVFPGDFLF